MKCVGYLGIALALVAFGFNANNTVHAETVSKTQQITISTRVLASQYIIINAEGTIIEINSNSSDAAVPKVYVDSILAGNERPLSLAVQAQYRQIISPGTLKPGVLYKKSIYDVIPILRYDSLGPLSKTRAVSSSMTPYISFL